MTDIISLILSQSFLTRALLVGVLISFCSALLGATLVLKRFSMIGDGLSHVGFGSMAIALALNMAPLAFSLPVVVISAVFLLRIRESGKIKGDTAIALISTGALAVGVMVTSMTGGINIDIYNYMFGSILTMSNSDVLISVILSSVVITLFIIFYNEIFAVTFDESFARATGTKTSFYNTLIACLTAVTIVVGMRMMGALLISSLIIFPTVTSMRLCRSFRSVVCMSTVISVFCFVCGLIFSIRYEAPTGASVVCVNIFMLVVFSAFKLTKKMADEEQKCSFRKFAGAVLTVIFILIFIFTMGSSYFVSRESDKDRISVVTTGFAHYDFARSIAGEMADVTMLLSPGEESHTFEPTPQDMLRINECDVFIYNGGESEKWVDKIIGSLDEDTVVVKFMDEVELKKAEHHNHEEHHGEDEHDDEYDEHIWTSPKNAIVLVQAVCRSLVKVDAKNEEYYLNNLAKYTEELKALDQEIEYTVRNAEDNLIIIGDRFPLKYFVEEYSIKHKSAFPGCSASVEANPVVISDLINIIKREDIPVVFKVDLSTGLVAQTISEATGAEILTLYSCHVISEEDFKKGETYISLMKRNNLALERALS